MPTSGNPAAADEEALDVEPDEELGLYVCNCPPDEVDKKPPYLAAALEYGAVAAADGLIEAEGSANEPLVTPPLD